MSGLKSATNLQSLLTKIRSLINCVFVLLVFLLSFPAASKQQDFRFHKLTIENGLSQSTVYDIVNDNHGYMWFATQDGLNRFDGVEVKVFKHSKNDDSSLSSSWVEKIIFDNDRLWVLTQVGLDSIDLNTMQVTRWGEQLKAQAFKEFESQGDGFKIWDFVLNANQQLYVLTSNKILILDKKSGFISEYPYAFENSNNEPKTSFVIDRRGDLYTIKGKNCIEKYYKDTEIKEDICSDENLSFSKLYLSTLNQDKILLDSKEGFFVLNTKSKEIQYKPIIENRTGLAVTIDDILEVKSGYWLATTSGVKYWDKQEKRVTSEFYADVEGDYSLLNRESFSLAISKDGLIWVGNARGVNYWHIKPQFKHLFRTKDVVPFKSSNYVTSLLEDANQELWIGTNDSGLFRYSKNRAVLDNLTTFEVDKNKVNIGYVEVLLEDRQQNIWSASEAGIFVKSANDTDFIPLKTEQLNDLEKKYLTFVSTMVEDRNGSIWLGSKRSLFKVTPVYTDTGSVDLAATSIVDMTHVVTKAFMQNSVGIYVIYEDLQGYLWLGGENGLVKLNPLTWKFEHFQYDATSSQSLSTNDVTTIYEDFQGVLWIGTTAGLNRVIYNENGDTLFKRITTEDGFKNDFICSILSDKNGYLWISTASGLVKYHPNSQEITNFTYNDGLQYSEFYTKAQYVGKDDKLYFGGINGITAFSPSEISLKKRFQKLFITSVEQAGKNIPIEKVDGEDQVTIDDEGYLDINFSAFDFLNSQHLSYRYKVEQYSKEWFPLNSNRRVRLHSFEQEKIKLILQVKRIDGIWSPLVTQLNINVRKNIFQSTAAIFIYLLLIIGAMLLVIYFIYRRMVSFLQTKDNHYASEKAMNLDLIEENKSLDHQLKDMKYSISEQLYHVQQLQNKVDRFEVSDQLTGFKNKSYLRANIEHELESILMTWRENDDLKGVHLGIFALDIDNFELINKQYGVLCGNEVLKQTSESLKTISYGTDTLVRWEGHRLLILSRAITKREQILMAEKIRNIIASRKFDLSNGANIDITCSIGFTRFPFIENTEKPLTWEQLIYIAEQAVVVAQNNSKNAWVGIFSNRFTRRLEIEGKLAYDLPALVVSGQLDYVSSIPKSKKLIWY